MQYLFVDNFRGFSETFIPIRDVNFFVGENSTGKTSILSLLQLLATNHFWFFQSFDTDEVSFGHFNDIVSINAKKRTHFSIGVVNIPSHQKIKGREKEEANAFLMTFVEKQGMPDLRTYIYTFNDKEVHIQFEKDGPYFQCRKRVKNENFASFKKKICTRWLNAYRTPIKKLKKLRSDITKSEINNLMFATSLIEAQISQKSRHLRSKTVRAPIRNMLSNSYIRVTWLAPIRTKPRRTYDEYKLEFSPEGEHTPFLIRKILSNKTEAEKFKKFLKQFGRASGLFEDLSVKKYGRSNVSPFELDIILNRKALSVSNVGYGVSQALPVVVEFFARPKNTWFNVQQPEVHLHPRAQAALGDLMFRLAASEQKRFFIETHSDYLIDRFRLNYRTKKSDSPNSQILFFERTAIGNRVHLISISDEGQLQADQPKGYREFFLRESMKVLGL